MSDSWVAKVYIQFGIQLWDTTGTSSLQLTCIATANLRKETDLGLIQRTHGDRDSAEKHVDADLRRDI